MTTAAIVCLLLLLGVVCQDAGRPPKMYTPSAYLDESYKGECRSEYFLVAWRASSDRGVTKYEIKCERQSLPEPLEYRGQRDNDNNYFKFSNPDPEFFDPSFDHSFRARAFVGDKAGQWSDSRTYFAVTGRVPPPDNIKVNRADATYTVTFDPPTQDWPRRNLREYRIFYFDQAFVLLRFWKSVVVPAANRVATFQVDDPSKTYAVMVQVREDDGRYGNMSALILPQDYTLPPPGSPRNFRVSLVGERSVKVEWDAPENWQISGLYYYQLVYKRSDENTGTEMPYLPPDYSKYEAGRLVPDTEYTFTLTAMYLKEPVSEGPVTLTVKTRRRG